MNWTTSFPFHQTGVRQRASFAVRDLWKSATLSIVLIAVISTASARAASEIAVAIRYIQEKGVSHSHVYLYREDGVLLRQLTKDDSGQDSNPFFTPDGSAIVFTRTKGSASETWSIDPRGGGLRQLKEPPPWYRQAVDSGNAPDPQPPGKSDPNADAYTAPDETIHYRLPGGAEELIAQEHKEKNEPLWTYSLRDVKTGKQVELASNMRASMVMALKHAEHPYFLIDPPLRLAFVDEHLDSTDGNTVFVLDLNAHEAHELSPRPEPATPNAIGPTQGYGAPIPLPGEGAFLTITGVRYVPFGDGQKTASSSYFEHWDSKLHAIRYARPGASICYGASIYRPGKTPEVIRITDNE